MLIGALRLTRVLRVFPRFRKIRIRVLDARILVAMTQLTVHAGIPAIFAILRFKRAFLTILILMSIHR